MRAATTHSSGTTLFTFTALKCAITPIHEGYRNILLQKMSMFFFFFQPGLSCMYLWDVFQCRAVEGGGASSLSRLGGAVGGHAVQCGVCVRVTATTGTMGVGFYY